MTYRNPNYQKEYRQKNRALISMYGRNYYQANKDIITEKKRKYNQETEVARAAAKKRYYQEHKEALSIAKKKYRQENRVSILTQKKKYRQENKVAISLAGKRYYQENRAVVLAKVKKYNQDNREIANAWRRHEKRTNAQFKLATNLRTRLVGAIKRGTKTGSAVRDLGCTIPELKFYIEGKFKDGMTWENWGLTGWHLDHELPLNCFDLTNREQFLQACHYTNLQPMWAIENISKGAKVSDSLLKELVARVGRENNK